MLLPMEYADVVTTTTHKTLRGPRGGCILTNDEALAKKLNSAIFPGTQGGPLMHVIAAKAVCFGEALTPEFKAYQTQIKKNAQALADGLTKRGVKGAIFWGILGCTVLYYVCGILVPGFYDGFGANFSFAPFAAFSDFTKLSFGKVFTEGFDFSIYFF